MKRLLALIIAFIVVPSVVIAECSDTSKSIVLVNGILTETEKANRNLEKLRTELEGAGLQDFSIINGYNPTHLGGVGDSIQVISQTFGKPLSSFDRDTILRKVHRELNTRKVLLVGHSQGTFYTNEIYEYLVKNGVSKESIAVYNVATPASYVAGGGTYLTSANDNLVTNVRQWTATAGANEPLTANILIPVAHPEVKELWRGHSFSGEYLAGASERIVRDIEKAISKLKTGDSAAESCFTPPEETMTQKAQKVFFAVADPTTEAGFAAAAQAGRVAVAFKNDSVAGVKFLGNALAGLFKSPNVAANQAGAAALAVSSAEASTQQERKQSAQTQAAANVSTGVQAPVQTEPTALSAAPAAPLVPSQTPTPEPSPPQLTVMPAPQSEVPSPYSYLVPVPVSPGFGAGGGGGGSGEEDSEDSVEVEVEIELAVTSPAEGTVQATTSVTASGTATDGTTITVTYGSDIATTTASGGVWSLSLALLEGDTPFSFIAADSEGNESDAVARTVTVDTMAPAAPVFAITECDFSLSSSFCLLASEDVELTWSDVSGAANYAVVINGIAQTVITATTSSSAIASGATSTFAVVAYDAAGNSATSTEVDVYATSSPLFINEIAWAGTDALATDEWIELYNTSPYALNLSSVVLDIDGSGIALSGTLAAGGLYLIEDREEATSKAHNLISDLSLDDAGAKIQLTDGNGAQLDATPDVATCAGWCEGSASATIGTSPQRGTLTAKLTMERVSSATDGTLSASWHDNDTYIRLSSDRADDANNDDIIGTPAVANSSGLPSAGWSCGDGVLASPGGAYNPTFSFCAYLTAFIHTNANRHGAVFQGTVGSSTLVAGGGLNKVISGEINTSGLLTALTTSNAGDGFFVALYETRTGPAYDDIFDFVDYFEGDEPNPPHNNFVTIPWTYEP